MALHRKATGSQRRHWSLNRTSYMLIQFLRQTLVTDFMNTNNVVWDSLLLSVKWGLKIILNSLGWVTSLPLGSTVVGLSQFSLWTSVFCSISSADDGRFILLSLGPRVSLVRARCAAGRWGWSLDRRRYWMHFTTPSNPRTASWAILGFVCWWWASDNDRM